MAETDRQRINQQLKMNDTDLRDVGRVFGREVRREIDKMSTEGRDKGSRPESQNEKVGV